MSWAPSKFEQSFRDIGLLPKLTDWISGDIKPAIPGIYQRHLPSFPPDLGIWTRWDGAGWCLASADILRAAEVVEHAPSQDLPWRGLAEPPR